mgnify:CR=1 FL=1
MLLSFLKIEVIKSLNPKGKGGEKYDQGRFSGAGCQKG